MKVACSAKINTFLAVGPPDDRGWHPLRTIFQEIELADELTIEPSATGEDEVTFSIQGIPAENTVTKALRLIREYVQLPAQKIHVTKRIPAESGLGGGSSDAAAVLRTLGRDLPEKTLHKIALGVGADVPFFLVGGRARGEGYGEKLLALPDLPLRWLVLARPAEGCSTGEMFRQLDSQTRPFRPFPESDELYNDFERVAPCGSLDLIERLRVHGANDAGLTGSGSVVFGRFPSADTAKMAANRLKNEAPWVELTRTKVTPSG